MNVTEFQGPNRFLSNFWPATVRMDGDNYPSVEHAYQAAKFPRESRKPFRDFNLRAEEAKAMGKGKGGRDFRERNLGLMLDLIRQKFSDSVSLKEKLLATGSAELIEGNAWHDIFYGVCNGRCRQGPHKPVGDNHLGKILMQVRDELNSDLD